MQRSPVFLDLELVPSANPMLTSDIVKCAPWLTISSLRAGIFAQTCGVADLQDHTKSLHSGMLRVTPRGWQGSLEGVLSPIQGKNFQVEHLNDGGPASVS